MAWRRIAALQARVAWLEERAVEIALLALVGLNAVNIVSRYLLRGRMGETFELMVLGAVALYWIGIGTAQRHEAHLGMSYVVGKLPPRVRAPLAVLRRAVIVGLLLVLIYAGTTLTVSQYGAGSVSGTMGLSLWWFTLAMPVGLLVMLMRVLRPPRSPVAGLRTSIATEPPR